MGAHAFFVVVWEIYIFTFLSFARYVDDLLVSDCYLVIFSLWFRAFKHFQNKSVVTDTFHLRRVHLRQVKNLLWVHQTLKMQQQKKEETCQGGIFTGILDDTKSSDLTGNICKKNELFHCDEARTKFFL